MATAYEIINGTPLTDKMREQIKHYRNNWTAFSRIKAVETEIMFNTDFSYEENVRIFFEVAAYLFSIEQAEVAEVAVEEICENREYYLDSSLPASRHSE